IEQVDAAFGKVRTETERPTVIVARTIKGKGFSEIEDKAGWHGKPLPPDMAERAIAELGGVRHLTVQAHRPEGEAPPEPRARAARVAVTLPAYELGDKVPTRKAYGDALRALGARPDVVAMDGEVSNSTHADEFA